ncbi:transposase [Pseudomonas sp. NFX224]|uniref:transposase n=1 Tax=Pseudomonas sp. NFX224 TaxID=3402862 RepID=UPI003AFA9FAA
MPVCLNASHLRIGRFPETGCIYLLTAVVHRRQPVFTDWRLGGLVALELHKAQKENWADFLTWIVMPDHMHCLVQLRDKTLAELMCRIKSRCAVERSQRQLQRFRPPRNLRATRSNVEAGLLAKNDNAIFNLPAGSYSLHQP